MSSENKLDEQKLIQEYNSDPSPTTFTSLINHLRLQKKDEIVRETRLNYISKFSMNEEMWLQWLEDEYKPQGNNSLYEQLLQMALNDLPLSIPIRMFQINHSANKIEAIESAIKYIGEFDNSIWEEYRKLQPEKTDELYRMQLQHPVPDYDLILSEFQLLLMADGKPPFEPPKDVLESVEKIKLHKSDFQTLFNAVQHVRMFPEEKTFEHALSFYPYSPQIWISYLEHFPTNALAARAVRFCPTSGMLWAMYARITKTVNTSGFIFIKDDTEAQILLGQLAAMDKEKAVSLIQSALKCPIFQNKDSWIWPTLLLEEHMKCQNASFEERKALFKSAIERNSQSLELWNKLISIVSETEDEEQIRDVYRQAASILEINLPILIQNWIIFETTSKTNKIEEVIQILNEKSQIANENVDETSEDYDKRTIFVANFKDMVTEDELQQFFSQVGEVESVRMKRRHGRTTFAFVQFRYLKSAENSVKMLNGAMFRGQPIEVKPHQFREKLTLFIRYATTAQPSEVIDFLKEKTGVSSFKLRLGNEKKQDSKETGNRTKGWGFIDVNSDEDAMKIMTMSGKIFKCQALKIEVANKNQKEAHQEKKENPKKVEKTQNKYQQNKQQPPKNVVIHQKPPPPPPPPPPSPVQENEVQENDERLRNFFGL